MKIISRKLIPVEQKAYPRLPTYVKFQCVKWGVFLLVESI